MTTRSRPHNSIMIGGSEIGRCLVRLHHDRFTEVETIDDPVRDRVMAQGIAFEDALINRLMTDNVMSVDLRESAHVNRARATVAAMDSGAELIAGGRLESSDGASVGMPDLLARFGDGYAPIEVKHHKVIGDGGLEAWVAPLSSLTLLPDEPVKFRSFRRRDLLQVAHYRSLLLEIGMATSRPLGAVIGTDDPLGCAWVDLSTGTRPINEEYETFVQDARAAVSHGLDHPADPMYTPWLHGECSRCHWNSVCLAELTHVDDPTLLRGIGRDQRSELRAAAITTVAEVAALPLENELVDGGVVMQARAQTAGSLLRNHPGADDTPLPSSTVEIDFDIETLGGQIYLAGLLITTDGDSLYDPIADWSGTVEGEGRVVAELFDRFASWTANFVLYHWTEYEVRILTEAAARHGLGIDGYDTVSSWFEQHAIDLCAWSRQHLVSPEGHGLKVIAPMCGFSWRDDDPGGLQSEIWFEQLLEGDNTMKRRLLAYNEDDVLAQIAVRSWVRAADSGKGPGSAIPSVHTWNTGSVGTKRSS